jgi:hypothetical protein
LGGTRFPCCIASYGVFRLLVLYLLRRSYYLGSKSSIRAQVLTVIPVSGFITKVTKQKTKKISHTSYL